MGYNTLIPKTLRKELKEHGFRKFLPRYSDVFDWLSKKQDINIVIEPFFTFSTKNNTAYTWSIYYMDINHECLRKITEEELCNESGFGGSFNLTARVAIESSFPFFY